MDKKMKETIRAILFFILFIASLSALAFGESTTAKEKPVVDSPDIPITKPKDWNNLLEGTFHFDLGQPGQVSDYTKFFAILDKADAYFKKGDFKNALAKYRFAIEEYYSTFGEFKTIYPGSSESPCKKIFTKHCDTAVSNLRSILKKDVPDKWKVYNSLGFFCARLGKFDLALNYFKEAKKLDPELIDVKTEMAIQYIFQKELNKSITELRKIVKNDPSNATAWQFMGVVALGLNLLEESEQAFIKALELEPQNVQNLRSYTWLTFAMNKAKPSLAIKNLSQVISKDPKDIGSLKTRAYLYLANKDYDEAIGDLTLALKINPNDKFSLMKRALVFCIKENYKGAIADYSKLIYEFGGEDEEALLNRAIAYWHLGKMDSALADIQKLIVLQPNEMNHILMRAQIFSNSERYEESIADFSTLINKINGTENDCAGQTFSDLGLHDISGTDELYYNRVRLYYQLGKIPEAIKDMDLAIGLNKKKEYFLSRGFLFSENDSNKKALEDLEHALKMANEEKEPNDGFICEVHDQLSEVYSKLGDEKKSLFHAKMSELIKNKPDQDKAISPEIELPDFLK